MKYFKNIKHTVVLPSKIHGYGLFSTKKIKKGTLLCKLSGQIIPKKYFNNIYNKNKYPKDIFIEKHNLPKNLLLITPFRTSYSFINHSSKIEHLVEKFKNNIIYIYAKTDINSNVEILSKYDLSKHIDVLGGFKK